MSDKRAYTDLKQRFSDYMKWRDSITARFYVSPQTSE